MDGGTVVAKDIEHQRKFVVKCLHSIPMRISRHVPTKFDHYQGYFTKMKG